MDTSFFKSKEFRSLLNRYEQMQEYGINSYFSSDDLLEIASYYLFKNKSVDAENVISYARKLYPNDPQITEAEIRTLLSKGEIQEARRKLNGISVMDTPELQLLKTEVDMADGGDSSIMRLNAIMEETNLRDDLALNTLDVMIKGGFLTEALTWIEKGLRRYPSDIPLLEAKADCLVEQRRMQEALSLYNRLLDNNPYNYFYWEQLGYIYYVTGRWGKALECFDYELTTNSEAEYAKMMQAYCHYYLKDYQKAYDAFCELTAMYPGNVVSIFFSALSLCGLKRYAEALRYFEDLQLCGELTTAEALIVDINRTLIYDTAGNKDGAKMMMEKLLAYDIPDINMLALHGAGFLEIHDKESLLLRHMEVIEREPRNRDEILLEFALYIYSYGHTSLAVTVLKHTREKMFDSADVDSYIAYILYHSGQKDEALPYINSAIDGKSNILFDLFGAKYDTSVTADIFFDYLNKN